MNDRERMADAVEALERIRSEGQGVFITAYARTSGGGYEVQPLTRLNHKPGDWAFETFFAPSFVDAVERLAAELVGGQS